MTSWFNGLLFSLLLLSWDRLQGLIAPDPLILLMLTVLILHLDRPIHAWIYGGLVCLEHVGFLRSAQRLIHAEEVSLLLLQWWVRLFCVISSARVRQPGIHLVQPSGIRPHRWVIQLKQVAMALLQRLRIRPDFVGSIWPGVHLKQIRKIWLPGLLIRLAFGDRIRRQLLRSLNNLGVVWGYLRAQVDQICDLWLP